MKKTIVLILLLIPMLCFAGALQEKHRSVIAKKNVAAPAAGTWYWHPQATDGSYSATWSYDTGGPVTISSSGTVTALAVKVNQVNSATEFKIALYPSSGTQTPIANCSGTCTPVNTSWCVATVSSCSVTASQEYRVAFKSDTETTAATVYDNANEDVGLRRYSPNTYSAFPNSEITWDDVVYDECPMVAICAGGACSGTPN